MKKGVGKAESSDPDVALASGPCGACKRKGTLVVVQAVVGLSAPQALCADPVACRLHAEKVGIWKVGS